MKLNVQIGIIILMGWMGLVACQNEPARKPDPLNKAYQRIDRGEYNTAIEELIQLSQVDPRPEVLVALSSAYAARGGIKVAQYWGFVVGFKTRLINPEQVPTKPTIESLQRISQQTNSKAKQADIEALANLVQAVALWELYQDRIDAIPVVRGKQEEDLLIAIDVLAKVQTPGGRLYRAILNLILFKSHAVTAPELFEDFTGVVESTVKGDTQSLCNYDVTRFAKWIEPLTYRLSETLLDLTIAFPEQKEDLNSAQTQVLQAEDSIYKARQQLRKKRGCQ